jgi:hypothetical protein
LYKISLTNKIMSEIRNDNKQKMINLYYKVMWKPKVGDKVSELFYPENGVGTITDIIRDDYSSTALVRWGTAKQEYIETRHLSLVIDDTL